MDLLSVSFFIALCGRLSCCTWSTPLWCLSDLESHLFSLLQSYSDFSVRPKGASTPRFWEPWQLMTKLCVWLSLDLATLVAFCGVSSFSWLRLVNSKLAPQLRNPLEAQLHPFSSRFVSGILGLLEHLQALVTQWFCSLLFDGCAGWSFPV